MKEQIKIYRDGLSYSIEYTDDNGKIHNGELELGTDARGKTVYRFLKDIIWDDWGDDEQPENWEDIREYVDNNLFTLLAGFTLVIDGSRKF